MPVKDPCIRDELDQLVKTYQVDLLSSIGESEEYLRLHQTYPQLKAKLEPHYLKSRDVSSKILGKIRAIESVLAGYGKDGFEVEIDRFGQCFGTDDFKEGTTAFLDKRKPAFPGS